MILDPKSASDLEVFTIYFEILNEIIEYWTGTEEGMSYHRKLKEKAIKLVKEKTFNKKFSIRDKDLGKSPQSMSKQGSEPSSFAV